MRVSRLLWRAAGALLRARTPRPAIAAALLPANMQWKIDSLLDASRRWSDADLRRARDVLEASAGPKPQPALQT